MITQQTIVDLPGNWRAIWRDDQWWLQIKFDDGSWIWPDCAWMCKYCEGCLGCIRKVLSADFKNGNIEESTELSCPNSPTGFHVAAVDESKEEEL